MTGAPHPVEVHPDVKATISAASAAAHPRETGGLLLGWWDSRRIVVRDAVEVLDPNATSTSWTRNERPAQTALDNALAHHAHPWLGYVGDWHSHPAACKASSQDIAVIRRASAQYDQPLVLFVHRADGAIDVLVADRAAVVHTHTPTETMRGPASP